MKKLYSLYIITIAFVSSTAFSQSILTVDDAIKMGLGKNFNVLIAKNNQEIAKVQNNIGAAGMSPSVTVNGNLNLATLNSHQEFNTGVVQDKNGAQSNTSGASINAYWTIFDGLRMFAIKKRLNENEQLSAVYLKQQMENTTYDIIAAYYNIVKTDALIKAAKQNLEIYEERKKIAQLKLQIGSDSKVDLLLSQSDYNKAKSSIIQLELDLLNAKTQLNQLISQPIDTDFKTTDSIIVNYNPTYEDLKKSSISTNSAIQISKQSELIAQQRIKEYRANNLPLIQLNGSYTFLRSQSQAGIVFLNRQTGLNGGVTASWLLFNGMKNQKLIKEANLVTLNQRYITQQTEQLVDASVFVNFKSFQMNKQIVDLETQNLADSKQVQVVSLERYKIGKASLLETIETQKNLEDAQVRYINALYAIKLAETELLRTNGALVK
ncbi:MAG: TolC family protein [Bacteroidota bacterium]